MPTTQITKAEKEMVSPVLSLVQVAKEKVKDKVRARVKAKVRARVKAKVRARVKDKVRARVKDKVRASKVRAGSGFTIRPGRSAGPERRTRSAGSTAR